jgi:hypothetical protein
MRPRDEFTLEHVIPQFLGGAYAEERYKTRKVCSRCNNNLGLFVDAAFEKNFLVHGFLQQAATVLCASNSNVGLPLTCMGNSDLVPPGMNPDEEVCEMWVGPLGEQIFWVRPKDDRLYWYMGGSPRTAKTVKTKAYFLFSEGSANNPLITWNSFRDAFEGRRVEKILCGAVGGGDPRSIGFKDGDTLDIKRVEYFKSMCTDEIYRKQNLAMYISFDVRFLAKISIGLSYCLFGSKVLATEYSDELYKALWYRPDDEMPKLRGSSLFSHEGDDTFKELTGVEHVTTLIIQRIGSEIALNMNLGKRLVWTAQICSCENLTTEDYDLVGDGLAIILSRPLRRAISLGLPEFMLHKSGSKINDEINELAVDSTVKQ